MALKKEIENEIGITLNYHKIGLIDTTKYFVNIVVYSYISQDIRNNEKKYFKLSDEYDNNVNRLAELQQKILNDNNDSEQLNDLDKETILKEVDSLEDNISYVDEVNKNQYVFYMRKREYVIDVNSDDDISLSYLYGKLKELDEFKDSEDC